jgi:hypothetical protein
MPYDLQYTLSARRVGKNFVDGEPCPQVAQSFDSTLRSGAHPETPLPAPVGATGTRREVLKNGRNDYRAGRHAILISSPANWQSSWSLSATR